MGYVLDADKKTKTTKNKKMIDLEKIITTVIITFVGIFVFCLSYITFEEIRFCYADSYEVECELIHINYSPSTCKTHIAPIISSNGTVSTAIYTTGNSEKKSTLWNCGKFGRLSSDRNDVFQFCKEKSILIIRSNNYDTRIVGIIRN